MKLLLLLCFFSPLLTVAVIHWSASGNELKTFEGILQPILGTAVLFWVWLSALQRLALQRLED